MALECICFSVKKLSVPGWFCQNANKPLFKCHWNLTTRGFKSFSLAVLFFVKKKTQKNNNSRLFRCYADSFKVPNLKGRDAITQTLCGWAALKVSTSYLRHHTGSVLYAARAAILNAYLGYFSNMNAPRKTSLGLSPYLEIKLKLNALGLKLGPLINSQWEPPVFSSWYVYQQTSRDLQTRAAREFPALLPSP